jgi:branched-subunit amino acid aminotransferase/4-amino-4-deoxychorismate lyase
MNPNPTYFFESILYRNSEFPLLRLHFQRISELADHLKLTLDFDIELLKSRLEAALYQKEEEQKLRLQFEIRELTLAIDIIETKATRPFHFNIYPSIALVTYTDYTKPTDKLGQWKQYNKALYEDSISFAQQFSASQSIILNKHREIVETSLSNFFYILKGKLFTPPLSSGAVNGVFRRFLIQNIAIEEKTLCLNELDKIEACFISSAIRGIVPVYSIDGRRYSIEEIEQLRTQTNKALSLT